MHGKVQVMYMFLSIDHNLWVTEKTAIVSMAGQIFSTWGKKYTAKSIEGLNAAKVYAKASELTSKNRKSDAQL